MLSQHQTANNVRPITQSFVASNLVRGQAFSPALSNAGGTNGNASPNGNIVLGAADLNAK